MYCSYLCVFIVIFMDIRFTKSKILLDYQPGIDMPLYQNCIDDETVCGPDEFCDPGGSLCQSCRVMCVWQFRKRCEKLCKNSTYYPAKPPPDIPSTISPTINTNPTPKLSTFLSSTLATVLSPLAPGKYEQIVEVTAPVSPQILKTREDGGESADQLVVILIICFIIIAFLLGMITVVLVYLLRKIRRSHNFYEDKVSNSGSSQAGLVSSHKDVEQQLAPLAPKIQECDLNAQRKKHGDAQDNIDEAAASTALLETG